MPVMLEDGAVVDSARLPADAIQEHPITVSAESLMQSISIERAPGDGQPLTYSGSPVESHQLLGQQLLDSTQPPGEVHYHPVRVRDPEALVAGGTLAGDLAIPNFLLEGFFS